MGEEMIKITNAITFRAFMLDLAIHGRDDITTNRRIEQMRIFWWQHGLHAEPESQEEADALVALVKSIRWGRDMTSDTTLPSSADQGSKLAIGDPKLVPSTLLGGDLNQQETIG